MSPDEFQPTIDRPSREVVRQESETVSTIHDQSSQAETMVGRYSLGREIASGGMGVVLKATDTILQREIAVKVLQGRIASNSTAARRFADEARITGQLQHPAIPPVHDFGKLPDGTLFLAMKLIKGDTLDELLKRRLTVHQDRGRFIAAFEQIAQAIAYAHAHNVIHRDLKPANVMLGSFGEVQVMDWGLAKILDPNATSGFEDDPEATLAATEIRSGREDSFDAYTMAGSVLGTPAFMPPEQAIGAVDQIGKASDVFGLGAILAVILTGKPPFVADSSETTRQLSAKGKVEDCYARLDETGADPEWITLCRKCLAPEPKDRYVDASAVAAIVAQLRADADERARQAEVETASLAIQADEERKRSDLELRLTNEKQAVERRRLKLRSQLSAAIAATLLVGVCASVWQAIRARNAEIATVEQLKQTKLAELKAKKARDRARDVLDTMTSEVTGESLATQKTISLEQKTFLAEVLTHYQELADGISDDELTQSRTSDAAYRIAMIQYRLGLNQEALDSLQKSLGLASKLSSDYPSNPDYLDATAIGHFSIGAVLSNDFEQYAEALISHGNALSIFQTLTKDHPGTRKYRARIGQCLQNISATHRKLEQPEMALTYLRQSVEVYQQLLAEYPDERNYRERLAENLSYTGLAHYSLQNSSESLAFFLQAATMYDQLLGDDPSNMVYREEMASAYGYLGVCQSNFQKQYSDALESLEKALAIYEELAIDFPEKDKYRERVAECQHNRGVTFYRFENLDASLDSHRQALAVRSRLLLKAPKRTDYAIDTVESYERIAEILTELNQDAEALSHHKQALSIQEGLIAEIADVSNYRSTLANIRDNVGDSLRELNEYSEALASYRQALAIRQELFEENKESPNIHIQLRNSYYRIGVVLQKTGQLREARDSYERMHELLELLTESEPNNASYQELLNDSHSLQLSLLVDIYLEENNQDSLYKTVAEYEKLAERIADESYNVACIWARISDSVKADEGKRELSRDRAMAWLVKVPVGPNFTFKTFALLDEHISQDQDLDPLRERSDFIQFVSDLSSQQLDKPATPLIDEK